MLKVGQVLRDAREQLGLSLITCEEATRIRRKYLEALEEGRVVDLPGEVYVKGFLRTYGNYLGLDGAALVDQYKGTLRADARRQAADGGTAHAVPEEGENRPPSPVRRPVARPGALQLIVRRLVVGSIVLAAAAAIVYGGWRVGQQVSMKTDPDTEEPTPSSDQTPPPQPQPDPKQDDPPPPPKPPEPAKVLMAAPVGDSISWTVPAQRVEIKLEMDGRVWMSVQGEGKVLFEGVVEPGTVKEFSSPGTLRVRVGYADPVSVTVNGQQFGKVVKSGPWNYVFTAKP